MNVFQLFNNWTLILRNFLIGVVSLFLIILFFCSAWSFSLVTIPQDMTFTPSGDALIVNGETQTDTLAKFKVALDRYPDTRTIILNIVPGSDDDDVNLKLARVIRKKNLSTHLTKDSVIESGGIELFMGGVERTMERGARVGVHSWIDEDDGYEAHELPKDHADHKPYIKTYQKLGIHKSFYWFVVNAAPSNGMYFMTEEELERFKLLTKPIIEPGQ